MALLLGLGVAVAARMSGMFAPPPPAPAPVPPPDVQVLVPTHNLFEGFVIQANDVAARALRPDELAEYKSHPEQYLPPVPQAAVLRVTSKNVEAERPLTRDALADLRLADPIHQRLVPNMRAVNLEATKDRCAGGLIQVGDWVDVHLTSTIEAPDGRAATHTANLVHFVRVIAKRNLLWQVLAPLPDDQPVTFTLEANPYRAALVEFAKTKGAVTLVPVAAAERQRLESRRQALLRAGSKAPAPTFAEPDSEEYRDEDRRVEAFTRGDRTVGDTDLIRIFGLQTLAPPLSTVAVQVYQGVERKGDVVFDAEGTRVEQGGTPGSAGAAAARSAARHPLPSFQFRAPDDSAPRKCKTCGKNSGG